jgi:hypothetical protein
MMDPVPVGTQIRVVGNCNHHSYTVGDVYTVSYVDSDGTLKASDSSGTTRDWLQWRDCEPAGHSLWEQLAAGLPEDLVLFLSAFDGISLISLKPEIIDAILARQPDLHERILALLRTPEGADMVKGNMPRPLPSAVSSH